MKIPFKFIGMVLVLLLTSAFVLTGSMYAIGAERGEAQRYDRGSQIRVDSNTVVVDEPPISQAELQKKFSMMYDIGEDGKSITAISNEYLKEFWQSNYEKEVIHSLTAEEVSFVIADSFRIYFEYDQVILADFGSVSSDKQIAERFPLLKGAELAFHSEKSSIDREKIESDIYTIIMYRLKALSSPKAFFTGADAIRFVGGDPKLYSSMYPESVFYIPGYSANTDRNRILSVMGGKGNYTDFENCPDLFEVSVEGSTDIRFIPTTNGTVVEVFPDVFMTENIFTPHFILDAAHKRFRLAEMYRTTAIGGSYVQKGDQLILYPNDGNASEEYVYVFLYREGVGYNYIQGESNPIPGYEFEDEKLFILSGNALIPDR